MSNNRTWGAPDFAQNLQWEFYNIFANASKNATNINVSLAPYSALYDPEQPYAGYYPGCILAPVKNFLNNFVYDNVGTVFIYDGGVWQVQIAQTEAVQEPLPQLGFFRLPCEVGANTFFTNYDVSQYGIPTEKQTNRILCILNDQSINSRANALGQIPVVALTSNAQLKLDQIYYDVKYNKNPTVVENVKAICSYYFDGGYIPYANGSGGVLNIN